MRTMSALRPLAPLQSICSATVSPENDPAVQMRVELAREHAAGDVHLAQVPNGGRVDPAAMFHHQLDHRRIRRLPAW